MKLNLCFSTCPNDTFMFDAMVNGRIETHGFDFDIHLADIDELNRLAIEGIPDITKISFNAFARVSDSYQLLSAGSALGSGVGPLLVSRRLIYPDEIKHTKIAIPGLETTANMLFSIAFSDAINKIVYLFSDIEDAILSNEVDAGLIIHENRFTYESKGLKKVLDLGEFWENLTHLPIPLGGIAIRRSLPEAVKLKVNKIMRSSVEHAFAFPKQSYHYVRKYAQSMDEDVMYKHIQLYVNQYSVDLGEKGRNAITQLYERTYELNIIPKPNNDFFINF
ncbi:MAG TPA: 1,4-dihydroxy-6-naphthoate synthase [Bacteroidales bacterium]|nr:1,4-dihydroxy-6-naphthoate synthase [Bacteroidales bacterium]